MEINLAKVLAYSKDCLQSRAQMRSIMMDMYPGKTRDMNVLLSVYESGIPKKIKNEGRINEAQYVSYVNKIADDYGLNEIYIKEALNAWLDICIGPGTAATINISSSDLAGIHRGSYTQPIVHNPTNTNAIPVIGQVSDYEVTDLGNGTIEIKKFIGFDQADTIIPTEIGGKRVVGLGVNAFKQCKGILRLIIPEGIEYISEGAFCECSGLKKVVLPTSLKQLGRKENNSSFRIGTDSNGAFQGTAISEIDLPNAIKIIGENTFRNCHNLSRILFPDELRVIESSAFSMCKNLTDVVLPSKVEKLEYGAFDFCDRLKNVTLNEGLKSIQGGVFNYDPALTYLVIPRSVIDFGKNIIGAGSPNVTIGCYPGSKAIEYARHNNLKIADVTK